MPVNVCGAINNLGAGVFNTIAPAKINITLRIGEKGIDGMHRIEGIMQTVSCPADLVELRVMQRQDIDLRDCAVRNSRDDIVTKTLYELSKDVGRLPCRITLHKSIPVASGMGGGSSDAAAVLRLANHAFGIGMNTNDLENVASRVGNDVAFLVRGGRARVSGGRIHIINDIGDTPGLHYLIARPHMRLQTKEMFELYDRRNGAGALHNNDFTDIACTLCPDTKKLLDLMRRNAVEAGVTGKGPTVFAGYHTHERCKDVGKSISKWLNGELFIGTAARYRYN
ncbi:MAG: 4-(cytidine 5'-diphospho)-2-C-methyl-D-erythritol kinase [Candidatus Micrarchaeaceae archaeon]